MVAQKCSQMPINPVRTGYYRAKPHNVGNFADLAEGEHALMRERDLRLTGSQMPLTIRLLVRKMEQLTYRDKADFSN